MQISRRISILALLAAMSCAAAFGQTTAAELTGRIIDPSGGIIDGVSVSVINEATGVKRDTVSNAAGNYTVPLLEPGDYRVVVEKKGFRPINRSGITLHVNQVARIDFAMELGQVSDTISVTAEAPLLDASQGSLGAVVDNSRVTNLPLNGRNPFDLVRLVPAVETYTRGNLPGNNIPLTTMSINGGMALSNEVLMDGIPDTAPQFNQFVVVPSIDTVQEFKVQTNNMSAEFGRSTGGTINLSMKGGTNQFHGTAYDFLRNSQLDANNWFNNLNAQRRLPFTFNQFGGTVGGPIRHDKTFFFFGYEGLRRHTGDSFLFSVPTVAQRQGDFTQTRAQNGQPITVYDPLTSRQLSDGSYVRDAFPGNQIPVGRQNPQSLAMLKYWALPNVAGNPVTGVNNFLGAASETYSVDQLNTRIDHSFSEKNRLFGRISWNSTKFNPANVFNNIANPSSGPQLFTQRNFALNDTHAFTPDTFATFRIGFLRLRDNCEPLGKGFDPTSLGFPQYFASVFPVPSFPSITVNGYTIANIGFGTGSLGPVTSQPFNNLSNAYTAQTDVTHAMGNQTLKAGADVRLFRNAGWRPPIPNFTFGTTYSQGPDPTKGTATGGQSMADYLLGLAASGQVVNRPTQDTQSYYAAGFFQDDYKVRPNLTLNLGARFETESLRTDRYNRLDTLDYTSPSPLQAPGLGPLRGGVQFVGVNGNPRQQSSTERFVSPRFGFAWQAKSHIVVRGGYGIFVGPRTRWDFTSFGQDGFLATTPLVTSTNGITPINYISNPYPNGFLKPTGSSLGLLTNVGGSLSDVDRNQQTMYTQQWNLSLQRTLPGNIVIEASYAGSKGTHLWQSQQYNQLPDQDLALGVKLNQTVANPFFGLIPSTQALGLATTTYGQLLRPYPQFTGFSPIGDTGAASIYHSLQVRVEKRYSSGLTLLLAYTAAKLITNDSPNDGVGWGATATGYQDFNNLKAERSLSAFDVSQRMSLSYQYDLPFGPGKHFLNAGPAGLEKLVGGWHFVGITTLQGGFPLVLSTSVNNTNSYGGGSRPNSTGQSANLSGSVESRLNQYFNVSAFTLPAPYTFGNVAYTLPDVRGPGIVNFDFSLLKDITVLEKIKLELRAEAFNVLNHANFGLPATAIGSPSAGVISSASDPRILQLALKLIF